MNTSPTPRRDAFAQSHRGMNVIFIHSSLDDANLSLSEFRIYAHIARRSGGGDARPGVESIARICRMHHDTVRSSIKNLQALKMLRIEPRPGDTNLYYLTPPDEWIKPTEKATPPLKSPLPKNHPPEKEIPAPPEKEGGYPPEKEGDKGYTSKDIPEGNTVPPVVTDPKKLLERQTLEVYELYPRKVAKPIAVQKIRKAIQKFGFEAVKKATAAFAKAWENEDLGYCPHPSTWYHQERFNDAPETWARHGDSGGRREPAERRPSPVADRIALEGGIKLLKEQVEKLERETLHNHDRTPEKMKQLRELRQRLTKAEGKLLDLVC